MHSIVSVGSKYLLLVLSNSLKLTNKTNLGRGYTYTVLMKRNTDIHGR